MKVAFAIDGSTHSIDALRWGIKAFLPRGTSNEIILLSCGAVPSDMFGLDITSLEPFDAASIMQDERIIEEARNKARQVLTQTALPVLKEELADLGLQVGFLIQLTSIDWMKLLSNHFDIYRTFNTSSRPLLPRIQKTLLFNIARTIMSISWL